MEAHSSGKRKLDNTDIIHASNFDNLSPSAKREHIDLSGDTHSSVVFDSSRGLDNSETSGFAYHPNLTTQQSRVQTQPSRLSPPSALRNQIVDLTAAESTFSLGRKTPRSALKAIDIIFSQIPGRRNRRNLYIPC